MSKFFRKGVDNNEIAEVLEDLNSLDTKKQRNAVKRIIANMTLGKDVKGVFTDVLKCVQTDDLELKKLIYLYLINYSAKNPEATILAVNTFDNDTRDKDNPLVRALAIRTMACIRVEQITEYISEPLRRCLHDLDPFVRKTAALAVAKLFDIDPDLCVDQGFLDDLRELLVDGNQMVVSNAVAAFSDIVARSGNKDLFIITQDIANSLLNALNECNEWGQSFILDALVTYVPNELGAADEAELCIERICPRLQHANSGVALSAIRAIIHFLDFFNNNDNKKNPPQFDQLDPKVQQYLRKIVPPLITLLSGESEIQYVALRCVPILLARYPGLLSKHPKVFFPRYSDAIYVKMEKLDILVEIADSSNVDAILLELRENAKEIDVAFSRKCVKCIGKIAVAFSNEPPSTSDSETTVGDKCVGVLLRLITPDFKEGGSINPHILTECTITLCNIFRAYPNTYEHTIEKICDAMENTNTDGTDSNGGSGTTLLDDPECLCSLVWMVGEYADRIDNPLDTLHYITRTDSVIEDELDENGVETGNTKIICNSGAFLEESPEVQLCIINSLVKMYLHANATGSPDLARTQSMLQNILELATEGEATTGVDKNAINEAARTGNNVVINPDVRDRAYYYWRLLSTNISSPPANAVQNGAPFDLCRYVVLQPKPKISAQSGSMSGMGLAGNSSLLALLPSIGSLSSVLREPISFTKRNITSNLLSGDDDIDDDGADDERGFDHEDDGNLQKDDVLGAANGAPVPQTGLQPPQQPASDDLLGLMGLGGQTQHSQPQQQAVSNPANDLLGLLGSEGSNVNNTSHSNNAGLLGMMGADNNVVLPDSVTMRCPVNPQTCGYEVIAGWGTRRGSLAIVLKIKNDTPNQLNALQVKIEPNPLGICEANPNVQLNSQGAAGNGGIMDCFVQVRINNINGTMQPSSFGSLPNGLKIALHNPANNATFYVLIPLFLYVTFNRAMAGVPGISSPNDFERVWNSLIGEKNIVAQSRFGATSLTTKALISRFTRFGFNGLGEIGNSACCSGVFSFAGIPSFVLVRIIPNPSGGNISATVRVGPVGCSAPFAQSVANLMDQSIKSIMASQD